MEAIKILVVEDEAITAMDIKNRLSKLGYSVLGTSDTGKEAIKLTKKMHPNLILMDIVLKGDMTGTQAAQEISQQYSTPIIFLTAYKDEETFNRAKVSGPYGYITKPFEMRDLSNAIELALFKHDTREKLYVAEQRYRSVMENASCGIFIIDQEGIISDLNKQAELIFGDQRAQLIDNNFITRVHPEEQDYAAVQIQKLLTEKRIGPNIGRIMQPSGVIRDVEFSAVCIDNKDEKLIFSILNDITERNRLREQTLLSDKLSTVGTLAAGIIHEINNPMTFLLANLEYINKQIQVVMHDKKKQQDFLQKLNEIIEESIQGVQSVNTIIKDLKGFARVDYKHFVPANVHEAISVAIHMAHSQYKNKAKLETDFAVDMPLLMLDVNKLEQVILNLIVNAAQAMDNSNYCNNLICIKTTKEINAIRIDISDTGIGISSDILPRIFEPFFTTKPVGVGTGLGLSICYDIVKNMGGEIKVDSVPQKGTVFSIYLPMQLTVSPGAESPKLEPVIETPKNILVVNDSPALLIIIKRILEKHHQVTTCDSRAALELLVSPKKKFDAIITDLNMPDISGIDIYKYVSKNIPELENRIIFITSGAYTAMMKEFISSINNPLLEKPFTTNQLQQALSNIFAEKFH
jgi:two-component system cell cycle sensor histidine kinase/response regulator CckA